MARTRKGVVLPTFGRGASFVLLPAKHYAFSDQIKAVHGTCIWIPVLSYFLATFSRVQEYQIDSQHAQPTTKKKTNLLAGATPEKWSTSPEKRSFRIEQL